MSQKLRRLWASGSKARLCFWILYIEGPTQTDTKWFFDLQCREHSTALSAFISGDALVCCCRVLHVQAV